MFSKLIRIFQNFSKQINDQHIAAYASSTAFFTFLSLIPMLMVMLSAVPYMPFSQGDALAVISGFLPVSMYSVISEILDDLYAASGVMLPLTAAVTIWSAAKGMLALLRGLNVIFGVEEQRNYFVLRFRAAIYTVAMLVMILVLLVGVVFAYRIRDLLVGRYPSFRIVYDFIVNVRFLFVIAVMTVIFTALFTYLPNAKNKFHWELPGAFFVACAWYIASLLFSLYVNRVMGRNTYGSLTTVIVAMIWMYMIFYIMLLGASLNVFLHDTFVLIRSRQRDRRLLRRD